MEDSILAQKIKSGNSTFKEQALRYIYTWKVEVLRDIRYQLRAPEQRIFEEDVFYCGIKILEKNLLAEKWKGGSIKGFLRKICIYKSIDLVRQGPSFLENCAEDKKNKKKLSVNTELLIHLFDKIGFNCTIILWLYWAGYSYQRISEISGYKQKSAKSKRTKCQKGLINSIENDPEFKEVFVENVKHQT